MTWRNAPAATFSICGPRRAAISGASARGLVSKRPRWLILCGAWRIISIATMPPIDSPASAKRAGASARTSRARAAILSDPEIGATMTARSRDREAICGANRRASHIMPGRRSSGVLAIRARSFCGWGPVAGGRWGRCPHTPEVFSGTLKGGAFRAAWWDRRHHRCCGCGMRRHRRSWPGRGHGARPAALRMYRRGSGRCCRRHGPGANGRARA